MRSRRGGPRLLQAAKKGAHFTQRIRLIGRKYVVSAHQPYDSGSGTPDSRALACFSAEASIAV